MERSGQCLRIRTVFFSFQIFLVINPALSARTTNETSDKVSLLEFKAKINNDTLGILRSWNESVHFCSWPGVACSRRHHHRVTKLDLSSWRLTGQLSPHVGNLSFLRKLDLENNSFRLAIPPEIGRLFRLQALYLNNNSFSGDIPANISGCSSLRYLDLSFNNLTGRIPEDIGLLLGLQSVWLSDNNLVGEIPDSVGNLSSLLHLWLIENSLRGNIPHSLGQLKNLEELVLAYNNLTGTIPLSLYNVSTIKYFALSRNKLEGILPPNLGHTLPNLQNFYMDENNFYGSIPATISNVSNLVVFQVNNNNFTGKVPSFARSSNLQMLTLFNNNLGYAGNGDLDFLRDLSNCTKLRWLVLSHNNFGGPIPETISNMTSLERLTLRSNQISGNIPIGIGNLVNLEILAMDDNHLLGPLPTTVGKLRNIYLLLIGLNKLSGTIPSTLQNLTLLSALSLTSNNIQGSIPPSLGDCINLQELGLAENNLSGPIPSQLLGLPSLSIALDLSRNQLTGSIPIEVGKLVNLGSLDISENKLSGEIPKTLGSCMSLEYLNLRGNFLEGSIPKELKSLRGVQVIDLSHNKLFGKIPEYFADFRAVNYLNFSFNDFEGPVPQQGIFKNASKFSVMGNARLCGGLPELNLRSCTSNVHENHKLSSKIKLVIIIVCAVVGLIMFLFLGVLAFFTKKRSKPISEPSVGISLQRASYGDLFKATDGFSPEKLIGVGNFGSVYKGKLNQEDTLVAVKVLNLHVSRALKSFVSECESLRIIKHRNLVKILTVCSSIDFQGNDFKALVYEFMENGNLDEWLHSCQARVNNGQEQSRGLDLIQRVSIAVDVASALDYLHNHCPESIAHCDIKPSNILLDGHMVAHVGDFGLAKLLKSAFSNSSHESSSVGVRGTVGYVAPEYAMGSEVSTLGDIYSFGILLLEMFTGKRPTDSMFKDDFNLNNFASAALPERISEVLDPMLLEQEHQSSANTVVYRYDDKDQTVHKSLVSIFEIGVACSSTLPGERRNMGDVAAELCRVRDTLDAQRLA